MKVLVLGGTHHVGRAVVEAALARGDQVSTLNRGSVPAAAGVDARYADRRDPEALARALGEDHWDALVDTWSEEPVVVRDTARLLGGRVGHWTYISSRSVHAWPIGSGADESAPLVEADPASTDGTAYAEAKRGAEIALEQKLPGPALLARAGLILGPYEVVGRLPWWLARIAAGGRVPVPGPPLRPLQYIDGRDLADWVLACAAHGTTGAFNTVSRPGHTTIGELLAACRTATGADAELVWCTPDQIEAAGLTGWSDLPIWAPPTGEIAALHDGDVSAALAAGLTCRPVGETVADTWAWIEREGMPTQRSDRAGRLGIDAAVEAVLLAAADGR
ncbi:MAG: NAD-dependent epimerase/dehydratase family protein [Marmoricola sp.]|nr:NAD-dependent epimerase/dehydratase family protein [Marmoricola sp.]